MPFHFKNAYTLSFPPHLFTICIKKLRGQRKQEWRKEKGKDGKIRRGTVVSTLENEGSDVSSRFGHFFFFKVLMAILRFEIRLRWSDKVTGCREKHIIFWTLNLSDRKSIRKSQRWALVALFGIGFTIYGLTVFGLIFSIEKFLI